MLGCGDRHAGAAWVTGTATCGLSAAVSWSRAGGGALCHLHFDPRPGDGCPTQRRQHGVTELEKKFPSWS